MFDVAAANIEQVQKVQARAYNAKHARNAFAVDEKVWRMNPLWSTKLKVLRKGPKWVGPHEIVERKGGGNGNYVLKCLSGKNKGKINKSSYPPNHLVKYVIKNPDIPNGNTSESEYGSNNEDEAEEAPQSPVPSDVTSEIPVHTPVDSDDNTLPDLTVDEPPVSLHVHTPSVSSELPHICTPSVFSKPLHVHTPSKLFPGHTSSSSIPPACSDETMSAAQILADLADGGKEQPEPEPEPEEQVVFEDQALEEIDIDILVSGVQRPAAIKFKPLSLFCRKPAGARLGVHTGKQKGLKSVGLKFTGLSKVCGDDFDGETNRWLWKLFLQNDFLLAVGG